MTPPDWEEIKREVAATLELPPDERSARLGELRRHAPESAAEIEALVAAAESDPDFLARPAWESVATDDGAPAAAQLARVGPWRLGPLLGRGGMGEVRLGQRDDGAFEQKVAVKLLREDLGGGWLRRRFLAERRILAGLEHPNIARLVDGGATEAGVLYLVLEHVDGAPIDRWADERTLDVDARLRLFVKVTRAVEFAHRKLVLHRDLKTANILVDERGEPKLLDFGVAKLLTAGAADDATRLGTPRPLTPEWASPEQLRGEDLTTVSDVYSLGVLLHVLLTGHRPYRSSGESPETMARRIDERGEVRLRDATGPLPPGVDRRRLRGDLDWIAARALAPEQERRYGSAGDLAEDVERHLAGLPVAAHPASPGYRFRRFVRSHRAAATAALAIAASLLAATAVSFHQAARAENERRRAERRFDEVRRLANAALFDIHDTIAELPGSLPARLRLVGDALAYLDDLALEASGDPSLLLELASGYQRIAEIQGMPSWPSEGRTGDALASLERALELRRRAARLAPGVSEELAEARLLSRIGTVLAARGETTAALARQREAERLLVDAEARRDPEAPASADAERARELAIVRVAVGDAHWELAELDAASAAYTAALDAARAARAADPGATESLRQVGVVEQRLGDAAAERADWGAALVHHAASLAVDRELARRAPGDGEVRRDLGTDLSRAGADALALGRPAEALVHHEEARALRERLLAAEPADARAIEDAAESRFEVARVLAALGRSAEAAAEAGVAFERWRGLVERDRANVRWRAALADALAAAAAWDVAAGDRSAARQKLGEACALRRVLADESPDFASNLKALAELEQRRREIDVHRQELARQPAGN